MSNPDIRCVPCKKKFTRLEWMTNKICENPHCTCPEVKKSMKEAAEVIDRAMEKSRCTTTEITESSIPDGWDDTAEVGSQLQLSCPLVQVINITSIHRK